MVTVEDSIVIFDRQALKKVRARTSEQLCAHDFLIQWTKENLFSRLQDIKRIFKNRLYFDRQGAALELPHQKQKNIFLDEEFFPLRNESLDLIISTLTLHSTNDLPGCLLQMKKSLKPDGLFMAALFGGETLHELRASLMHAELELTDGASPRVFPFTDKQQMGALMQRAGYALPVVDSEIVTVTYDNIFKLMHDLRGMGESNIIVNRNRKPPARDLFMKAGQYYADHYSDPDGRIRATFEIIFVAGWSPHESQQKPLKPGSAQTRLADALKSEEIKTGDKIIP